MSDQVLSRPPCRSVRVALLAVALALPLPAAPAQDVLPAAPPAGDTLPGAVRGVDAVSSGDVRLPAVAAAHDMGAVELVSLLAQDRSLWITADARLAYVDIPAARPDTPADSSSFAGSIPVEDAFLLHSKPGATKVIFLDFDGHLSNNNGWGHNIDFPAWNTSGGSGSFTNGELLSIIAHWEYVAEDFAPFNVDVTTEDPGEDALRKQFMGDDTWGIRCVMTQPTDGFGNGIGGVALLSSFNDFQDTPCFVFNKGDNNGSMSASHEVGHTLGLFHDGLNGSEYHPGTGSGSTSWGPIMGAPFGKTVVHFSNGDYAGATQLQDDLAYITSFANGTGYRSDDFADTVAGADPLPVVCPGSFSTVEGRITTTDDVDALTFTTTGGSIDVTADPASPGPNLDILLELYDGTGALVASDNASNATDASLSTTLAAGTYTVRIEGVGKGSTYSDYGSIGQYTLVVDAPVAGSFTPVGAGLAGTGGQVPLLSGSGVACEGNLVTVDLSDALGNATAFLVYGFGQLNAPFKGGVLIPDIGLGGSVGLATSLAGTLSVPTTWPAGVGPGVVLDVQFWVQDPAGPAGFSASNGLELVTP